MNLDFFENLENAIDKTLSKNRPMNLENNPEITDIEVDLAEKLDAIQEFSVDRFEGEIAVLENRENKELVNIDRNNLPKEIREGSVLKKINGKYILDIEQTKHVEQRIRNKMDDLWH